MINIPFLLGQLEATESFGELAPPMQIAILLGALSFATAALVSMTAFTRIVIVLSFVRRALSTTEIPPNQVILGLSFFLTLFVMAPTLENINRDGIQPYLAFQKEKAEAEARAAETLEENSTTDVPDNLEGYSADLMATHSMDNTAPSSATHPAEEEALESFEIPELIGVISKEVRAFMTVHTRANDLQLFLDLSETEMPSAVSEVPLKVLIPAFIISELKTAFIMGFCIYIPFLLIDLVISTVLMSLGMMMMPPVIVSTPCKLLLFVLVDGWHLISQALVSSFQV